MAIFLLLALAALILLALFATPLRTALRRRTLRSQPFPAAWRDILRQRVPYFRQMPADLQLQLKKHIQVFIAEKPFIAVPGWRSPTRCASPLRRRPVCSP